CGTDIDNRVAPDPDSGGCRSLASATMPAALPPGNASYRRRLVAPYATSRWCEPPHLNINAAISIKGIEAMRKTIGILGMTVGIFIAGVSSASDTSGTKIMEVRVGIGSPSTGVIEIDRDPSSIPACATYSRNNNFHGRWFAVDLSTDGGREA